MANKHVCRKRQLGAVMLVSVSLLLVIASLVTVHTGRVKSLEHKILLNSQNQVLSVAAAQGGLAHGISSMKTDPNWLGEEHSVIMENSTRAIVRADFNQVQRNDMNTRWATIESTGLSPDGLSRHNVSEQVLRYPLLNIIPKAPLISTAPVPEALTLTLGANPNGGGVGVPVSIWSGEGITDLSINSATCTLQIFDENRCALDAYSDHTQISSDILSRHEQFPIDVLQHYFHIRMPDWQFLKSEASKIVNDCEEATLGDSRVIWVHGDCELDVRQHIGSEHTPVILILAEAALLMPNESRVFGMVIYISTHLPAVPKRIVMATGAHISGTLLLLSSIDNDMSQLVIRYHTDLLARLQQDDDMQRLGKISGSWRDF
tara:strand:+ start:449 stop:1573 length:1125 start_codon:yes stop_codon:yes gene_type:complete